MDNYRGVYPSISELVEAPGAIEDLQSFVDYTALLGTAAPPASAVAENLSAAISWRAVRHESSAWLAYVNAQDAIAWKAARASLSMLRPLFVIAVENNPALATKYPSLTQLFGAGKLAAQKAVATKKKADLAAARAAKKAAAAQAIAEAAEAKAAAAAAAVPAGGKTVTVSA